MVLLLLARSHRLHSQLTTMATLAVMYFMVQVVGITIVRIVQNHSHQRVRLLVLDIGRTKSV
jgi:hypothetical protein